MSEAHRGIRVLVADDEPSIRFVLQEALEGLGHQVEAVEDGHRALHELTRNEYDLAFLDIRMPGPTGIEVLQQVRASGADVAIVIITAQNLLENAVEAMKSGALDYLVKPFALAEVAALTEKALTTRALKDEVRSLRRAVARSVTPGHCAARWLAPSRRAAPGWSERATRFSRSSRRSERSRRATFRC